MAITITVKEPLHLDIRIDGETHSVDLAAGESSVHDAMAELLIAQGLATLSAPADEPKTKTSSKTKTPSNPLAEAPAEAINESVES